MKIEFKVSMGIEEKLNKEFMNVELEVDMASASREDLEKYALRAYKVELQSQIRPNWSDFIKGEYPKELKFGDGLFAKKKATRPPTEEEVRMAMKAKIQSMIAAGATPAEVMAEMMK